MICSVQISCGEQSEILVTLDIVASIRVLARVCLLLRQLCAGVKGMHLHSPNHFIFERGKLRVTQADLKTLESSNSLVSASCTLRFKVRGLWGVPGKSPRSPNNLIVTCTFVSWDKVHTHYVAQTDPLERRSKPPCLDLFELLDVIPYMIATYWKINYFEEFSGILCIFCFVFVPLSHLCVKSCFSDSSCSTTYFFFLRSKHCYTLWKW